MRTTEDPVNPRDQPLEGVEKTTRPTENHLDWSRGEGMDSLEIRTQRGGGG